MSNENAVEKSVKSRPVQKSQIFCSYFGKRTPKNLWYQLYQRKMCLIAFKLLGLIKMKVMLTSHTYVKLSMKNYYKWKFETFARGKGVRKGELKNIHWIH